MSQGMKEGRERELFSGGKSEDDGWLKRKRKKGRNWFGRKNQTL
jgi:hypothetical protein